MEFNKSFNPGAYPDRIDERDRQYKDVVFGAPQIDWEKGYDVEKELGITLKVENQGNSSSCVGQAVGKYTEVINFVETGVLINHSPKSVYEQIFLNDGGAFIRDGMEAIVDGGIALEKELSSYEESKPPSEEYMRLAKITKKIREEMKIYQSKEYRSVGSYNLELFAHAIMNNHGAVSGANGDNKGWSGKTKDDFVVKPPSTKDVWGHAFYFVAFGKDEKGIWFDFINSWGKDWGNNGRGRMYYDEYDMANNIFSAWTLIDLPNTNMIKSNIKIIKDKNSATCGIWLPATNPEALKSYCQNFGILIPENTDGSINWKEWLDGELELN